MTSPEVTARCPCTFFGVHHPHKTSLSMYEGGKWTKICQYIRFCPWLVGCLRKPMPTYDTFYCTCLGLSLGHCQCDNTINIKFKKKLLPKFVSQSHIQVYSFDVSDGKCHCDLQLTEYASLNQNLT